MNIFRQHSTFDLLRVDPEGSTSNNGLEIRHVLRPFIYGLKYRYLRLGIEEGNAGKLDRRPNGVCGMVWIWKFLTQWECRFLFTLIQPDCANQVVLSFVRSFAWNQSMGNHLPALSVPSVTSSALIVAWSCCLELLLREQASAEPDSKKAKARSESYSEALRHSSAYSRAQRRPPLT